TTPIVGAHWCGATAIHRTVKPLQSVCPFGLSTLLRAYSAIVTVSRRLARIPLERALGTSPSYVRRSTFTVDYCPSGRLSRQAGSVDDRYQPPSTNSPRCYPRFRVTFTALLRAWSRTGL